MYKAQEAIYVRISNPKDNITFEETIQNLEIKWTSKLKNPNFNNN